MPIKTVGFIALDDNGNRITKKTYSKASTAKGLMTKHKKKVAALKAAKEKADKLKLAKRLELAMTKK